MKLIIILPQHLNVDVAAMEVLFVPPKLTDTTLNGAATKLTRLKPPLSEAIHIRNL